jgi:hypothetical protein
VDGLGGAAVLGQIEDGRRLRYDHAELVRLAGVVEVLVGVLDPAAIMPP